MFRHLLDIAIPLILMAAILWQIIRGTTVVGTGLRSPWIRTSIDRDRDPDVFWISIAVQAAAVVVLGIWCVFKLFA